MHVECGTCKHLCTATNRMGQQDANHKQTTNSDDHWRCQLVGCLDGGIFTQNQITPTWRKVETKGLNFRFMWQNTHVWWGHRRKPSTGRSRRVSFCARIRAGSPHFRSRPSGGALRSSSPSSFRSGSRPPGHSCSPGQKKGTPKHWNVYLLQKCPLFNLVSFLWNPIANWPDLNSWVFPVEQQNTTGFFAFQRITWLYKIIICRIHVLSPPQHLTRTENYHFIFVNSNSRVDFPAPNENREFFIRKWTGDERYHGGERPGDARRVAVRLLREGAVIQRHQRRLQAYVLELEHKKAMFPCKQGPSMFEQSGQCVMNRRTVVLGGRRNDDDNHGDNFVGCVNWQKSGFSKHLRQYSCIYYSSLKWLRFLATDLQCQFPHCFFFRWGCLSENRAIKFFVVCQFCISFSLCLLV